MDFSGTCHWGVWEAFGAVLEIPEDVLEAVEHVPGALEVVLEAMPGQDSSRQALDIETLEKHEENHCFSASHRSVLEASWSVLEALGGVSEALEGVLKASSWRLGDQH